MNLAYTLMCWGRPIEARAYVGEAIAYAAEYEVHTLAEYAGTMLAWLRLRGPVSGRRRSVSPRASSPTASRFLSSSAHGADGARGAAG